MDHTAVVYLMDKHGQFVALFDLKRTPEAAAAEMRRFLCNTALAVPNRGARGTSFRVSATPNPWPDSDKTRRSCQPVLGFLPALRIVKELEERATLPQVILR